MVHRSIDVASSVPTLESRLRRIRRPTTPLCRRGHPYTAPSETHLCARTTARTTTTSPAPRDVIATAELEARDGVRDGARVVVDDVDGDDRLARDVVVVEMDARKGETWDDDDDDGER